MKNNFTTALCLSFLLIFSNKTFGKNVYDYVDPFISSESCRWFFFAPVCTPFGMVKLGPDNTGFQGYSGGGTRVGYSFSNDEIYGFSHLHEFQLGGILVMPVSINMLEQSRQKYKNEWWVSKICKASEVAKPGYYKAMIKDLNIVAELTATERVGLHRYHFIDSDEGAILINIGNLMGEAGLHQDKDIWNGSFKNALIKKIDESNFQAYLTFQPPYANGEITVFSHIKFKKKPKETLFFKGDKYFNDRNVISGFDIGLVTIFNTKKEKDIEINVALSFIDFTGAEKNLKYEIENKKFEDVLQETKGKWLEKLSRIKIEDNSINSEKLKKIFYTSLYHVLRGRGISSDYDGRYLATSNKIMQIPFANNSPKFSHFNTDSLWGAFSNLNQVWSLFYPETLTCFAHFLLNIYKDSGYLPDGFTVNRFTPGMLSNSSTALLAAAYLRNPKEFKEDELWNAVWQNQTKWLGRPRYTGNESLSSYDQIGFVPYDDKFYAATSDTLEFSFQDKCASNIAQKIGKKHQGKILNLRSESWKKIWDNDLKLFRPKSFSGIFYKQFSAQDGFSFAEGTASQYRWFVPHNINQLITLYGEKNFSHLLLDDLKNAKKNKYGLVSSDNTGGYKLNYNHGNQPSLITPWLLSFSENNNMAELFIHDICKTFYGDKPFHGFGYGQDEDQGQLGAWFILAAIGLFDVEGLTRENGKLININPIFEKVILEIPCTHCQPQKQCYKTLVKDNKKSTIPEFIEIKEILRCKNELP